MGRYMLVRRIPSGHLEIIGIFDDIESAIKCLNDDWKTQWANGFIFIIENIPLKIEIG